MQLIRIGLEHPDLRYEIFYGASLNERAWWDNSRAYAYGYRPTGRAEDFRDEALAAQAKLPADPVGDFFQGGTFCSAEFTGDRDGIWDLNSPAPRRHAHVCPLWWCRHRPSAGCKDMSVTDSIRIRCLQTIGEREIQGLSDVLIDCVEGGASVSFMLPMSRAKAEAFWRSTGASAARGERIVLAAEDASGTIVGTVQVILAQPENQPHRADIAKMLVHRRARRGGIGAALLAAAEDAARRAGKTLLVLDTASGDAERLYERHHWQRCGLIPGYALWPDGRPCATTIYFKPLVV